MSKDRLDEEELLHLAMTASKNDRHDEAISHLKQALAIAPKNAKALYFLGAEYAQIGMYPRAAEFMTNALDMDSGMHTARFQLGLLHLTGGDANTALAVLAPLEKLGEADPLFHFNAGLGHLIKDEFAQSTRALERGIELNRGNPALNRDMLQILERVRNPGTQAPASKKAADKGAEDQHVLLSAYQKPH